MSIRTLLIPSHQSTKQCHSFEEKARPKYAPVNCLNGLFWKSLTAAGCAKRQNASAKAAAYLYDKSFHQASNGGNIGMLSW